MKPSVQERVVAAVAHACALLPHIPVVGPLLILIWQHQRSSYASRQAVQAMLWQSLVAVARFALFALKLTPLAFLVPLLSPVVQVLYIFVALGGVLGAVRCLMGDDFRYPLIGGS